MLANSYCHPADFGGRWRLKAVLLLPAEGSARVMACFDSTDASYRLMRSAVKVLADRFTHSETASAAIVEHSLQIILADPDLLSDGSRGTFSGCATLPLNTSAFSTTCRLRQQPIIRMAWTRLLLLSRQRTRTGIAHGGNVSKRNGLSALRHAYCILQIEPLALSSVLTG